MALETILSYPRNRRQPTAGYFNSEFNNLGSNGNYWESDFNDEENGCKLNFNSGNVNPENNNNRYYGYSVRAVQHLSAR